ncbi:hypothetical protein ACSU6B_23200 [Neobacillus sp. C211]|uniref:hypothetical protein n=1 Tax=unclassified Neobacillus TaxID=2675272 RepID=UPI003978EEB2
MARKGINIKVTIDQRAINFFQRNAPHKLQQARKNVVEAAGMVWADEAKGITRAEDHIDTGLYINSIGYTTGSPSTPLYELNEGARETVLQIGADVAYAESLEKRYSIMARALDVAEPRMLQVAETQVRNTLGL